jgi:hypothetical protein
MEENHWEQTSNQRETCYTAEVALQANSEKEENSINGSKARTCIKMTK